MTPSELRKLLAQDENPKLDFKIDCSPSRDEEWNELIKDILALANGNVGFSHLPGYLIIGASDAKKPDGTRDLKDASAVPLKKRDLLAKVNGVCNPRLPNLEFEWVELSGAKLLVIIIPPTPRLYEIKISLQTPKRRFQEQTVFIRCGDEVLPASKEEQRAIEEEKARIGIQDIPVLLHVENESLDFITDPEILLPKLYNEEDNTDPLAYHRIPYQPRDPERDIQLELRSALNQTRYLLITGRSGLGKTREAAMLARALMLEGYRVVRIKRGLLEPPREFPLELAENHRRILIFIDDLNFLFRTGEPTETRKADELAKPALASYHDRLLATLDAFEKWCSESEIRVVATARDDADSWRVLEFSQRDRLWKRFTRFDLPVPKDTAIVNLLDAELADGAVQAEKNDFAAIARENDGTFANVVLNLQHARKTKQPLTLANYTPTLDGSWRDVYERAVAKHPVVRVIYDAIDLLRQVDAELYSWLVEPTACMLLEQGQKEHADCEKRVKRALQFLIQEKILVESESKLAPRDGQIEAKGNTVDWKQYSSSLREIMLRLANEHSKACLRSLEGFSVRLYHADRLEEAETLMRKVVEFNPQESHALSNLGIVLTRLKHWEEAKSALDNAIKRNPNSAYAHYQIGVYYTARNCFSEAEEAFQRAIVCDPKWAPAYSRLGLVLRKLERYEEAKSAYRRAVELNPNDFDDHIALGFLLGKMELFSEAEETFRHAIQMKPNDVEAWNNLACAYYKLERYAEAETALRHALECNHQFGDTYSNLGLVLEGQKKLSDAEAAHRHAIQINPSNANYHYCLANMLKELGRNTEAGEEYRQAIKIGPPNGDFYYQLGVLLNELERWTEAADVLKHAVELGPKDVRAQTELGIALAKTGHYAESESILYCLYELVANDPELHTQMWALLNALGREDEAAIEMEIFTASTLPFLIRVPPLGLEDYVELGTYCRQHNYLADLKELEQQARTHVAEDDWMNLARIESLCGNLNLSLDHLLCASEQEDFDPVQVSQDPALEWIRNHPRFSEIVVVPTETESDDNETENHDE
jgi:Flp pilus assembly protein TadD